MCGENVEQFGRQFFTRPIIEGHGDERPFHMDRAVADRGTHRCRGGLRRGPCEWAPVFVRLSQSRTRKEASREWKPPTRERKTKISPDKVVLYLADQWQSKRTGPVAISSPRERDYRPTRRTSGRNGSHPASKQAGWRLGPDRVAIQLISCSKSSPKSDENSAGRRSPRQSSQSRRLIEKRGHEVIAFASAEEAEVELERERLSIPDSRLDVPGKERSRTLPRVCAPSQMATKCIILLVTGAGRPGRPGAGAGSRCE